MLWHCESEASVGKRLDEAEEVPQETVTPDSTRKSVVREYAEALIVAVLLALVIRTFVVQAFKIPSGSMLPTLQIGDHILVNKFIYHFTPITRGDIIVFKFPQDETRDFIKRVIGLPGDKVEARNGVVLVNGRPLIEPYLRAGTTTDRLEEPVVVPEGQLLVLGDNRGVSADSRVFGTIAESTVVGRAVVRVWPLNRVSFL